MGSIELIKDVEFIKSTLNDEEVLSRISEDGQGVTFDDDMVNGLINNGLALGWFVGGEPVGFFWVHHFSYSVMQIHAHFTKANRVHTRGSGKAMLKYLKDNAPASVHKFVAFVPVIFPDVYNFSVREGLEDEGFLFESSYRDGVMVDQHILGINRGKI